MEHNYNENRDGSKETFKEVKLSVIIPTYNRAEKLKKCLSALSSREFREKEFEVIVVDDGSTDRTEEMIKRHQENKDLIIRYFVQKHQGAAAARNLGIKEAKGEIILFIGDDIIPKREFLQEHMTFHKENPAVNVAVLGNTTVSPEIRTQFLVWFDQNYQFDYKSIRHGQMVSWRYFYTSNISLKKNFLIESEERFNPKFKGYGWEDIEFGYQLFKKGLIILYNQRAAAYHDHFFNSKEAEERLFRSGQSARLFQQINPRAAELSNIDYPSFFQRMDTEVKKIILWPAKILFIKPFVWKYWAKVFTQIFYQGFKSEDKIKK